MGYEAVADGMINRLNNIMAITVSTVSKKMDRLQEVIKKAGQAIDGRGLTGIPTGSDVLNRWTGGWQPGQLVVWAARPQHGKTTNMIAAALEAAMSGVPVAFYTFGDLTPQAVYNNLAAMYAELSTGDIMRGHVNAQQQQAFINAVEMIGELPIEVFDRTDCGADISTVKSHMKVQYKTNEVRLFFLDYLQQMTCDYEAKTRRSNRNQELGAVSRGLKTFAESNDGCCVHVGSQLSKAIESRGGSRAVQSHDLRDTGELEQDADLILGVRRPVVYGIEEDDLGNDIRLVSIINCAKARFDGSLVGLEAMREFVNGRFQDFNPDASSDFSTPTEQPAVPVNTTIEPRKRNDDEDIPF